MSNQKLNQIDNKTYSQSQSQSQSQQYKHSNDPFGFIKTPNKLKGLINANKILNLEFNKLLQGTNYNKIVTYLYQ